MAENSSGNGERRGPAARQDSSQVIIQPKQSNARVPCYPVITLVLSRRGDLMADVLPLRRIDPVRFFVGNARESAYFYRNAFGFDVIAYAGLETRSRHEAGYVLRSDNITFVLASPLGPEHPASQRLALHGDGVQDIALEVDDVQTAYRT